VIAVPAGSVTHEHVGRITSDGFTIETVLDLPLHWRGVSLCTRHTRTGKEQVWDLYEHDVLYLQDPEPAAPPARWLQIAETIAEHVTTAPPLRPGVRCPDCGGGFRRHPASAGRITCENGHTWDAVSLP